MRHGPTSRKAYDPVVLVAYLDEMGTYRGDGQPPRMRHYINDVPVSPNNARLIRRWRHGDTEGVTIRTASRILEAHKLSLHTFEMWAIAQDRAAAKRGILTIPHKPIQE